MKLEERRWPISSCFMFSRLHAPPQQKRPPRGEPRRASPESGKGSVVPGDRPAATQGTQGDCVHLTYLMYDSSPDGANILPIFSQDRFLVWQSAILSAPR